MPVDPASNVAVAAGGAPLGSPLLSLLVWLGERLVLIILLSGEVPPLFYCYDLSFAFLNDRGAAAACEVDDSPFLIVFAAPTPAAASRVADYNCISSTINYNSV